MSDTKQVRITPGKNRYGVDTRYFGQKIDSITESLNDLTPDELFNMLSRLALTAATHAGLKVKMDIKHP